MTEEAKDKSKKFVLPKEARLMMVNFLESQNIDDADAMDDEKVLKIYNDCAVKAHDRANRYEITHETKSLNMYATQNDKIRLSNKELIARLFKMNVHAYYLHLFKDDDMHLSDKELWAIVNRSGIDPVKEVAAITKMKRSPIQQKAFK